MCLFRPTPNSQFLGFLQVLRVGPLKKPQTVCFFQGKFHWLGTSNLSWAQLAQTGSFSRKIHVFSMLGLRTFPGLNKPAFDLCFFQKEKHPQTPSCASISGARFFTIPGLPCPFFPVILLSGKPPETQGKRLFLKGTMVENNGHSVSLWLSILFRSRAKHIGVCFTLF